LIVEYYIAAIPLGSIEELGPDFHNPDPKVSDR
jgi:hypothetical protein